MIMQIIIFLLIGALLGFVVGWLVRGSKVQTELRDLDGRWRARLAEVEGERDRFVNELKQANALTAPRLSSEAVQDDGAGAELARLREFEATTKVTLADQEKQIATLRADLEQARDDLALARRDTSPQQEPAGEHPADARFAQEVETPAIEPALPEQQVLRPAIVEPESLQEALRETQAVSADEPAAMIEDSLPVGAVNGDRSALADAVGSRPPALDQAQAGQPDDLKKISGVGPKLERTLNDLGIFHFSQIANFTPENVAWVDRYLRFRGRIDREKWIEQAKVLSAGGDTGVSEASSPPL